jgi:hypothetical protein
MPDPSDLFTNVYVKGLGVEVKIISFHLYSLFIHAVHWKYLIYKFGYKQANTCHAYAIFNNPFLKKIGEGEIINSSGDTNDHFTTILYEIWTLCLEVTKSSLYH